MRGWTVCVSFTLRWRDLAVDLQAKMKIIPGSLLFPWIALHFKLACASGVRINYMRRWTGVGAYGSFGTDETYPITICAGTSGAVCAG